MVERVKKIPSFSILSDRLKGLLAFIVRYVEMAAGDYAVSYAKVNTQFLARTDFATMFRLLPETERKWLEEGPRRALHAGRPSVRQQARRVAQSLRRRHQAIRVVRTRHRR
jgi:hypothetical protein